MGFESGAPQASEEVGAAPSVQAAVEATQPVQATDAAAEDAEPTVPAVEAEPPPTAEPEPLRPVGKARNPDAFREAATPRRRAPAAGKRGRPSLGGERAVRKLREEYGKGTRAWEELKGVKTVAAAEEVLAELGDAAWDDAQPAAATGEPPASGAVTQPEATPAPPLPPPPPPAPPAPQKIRGVEVDQVHAWAEPARMVAGLLARAFDFVGDMPEMALFEGKPYEIKCGGNAEKRLAEDLAVAAAEHWPLLPSSNGQGKELTPTKALLVTAAAIAVPKLMPVLKPAAAWAAEKAKGVAMNVATRLAHRAARREAERQARAQAA